MCLHTVDLQGLNTNSRSGGSGYCAPSCCCHSNNENRNIFRRGGVTTKIVAYFSFSMHVIKESWYEGLSRQQHMGRISDTYILCDTCIQGPVAWRRSLIK